MKFILLINVKMQIVGMLTFITFKNIQARKIFFLNCFSFMRDHYLPYTDSYFQKKKVKS